MALGLFAFIAGLAGTHPHAATSRSDKDSIAAATPQKRHIRKKRPAGTTRAAAVKNSFRNNTATPDWQKQKPFSRTDISWSENIAHGKPASPHKTFADPWRLTVTKPATDGIGTGIHTGHSAGHPSEVFTGKNRKAIVEPAKTAFIDSDNADARAVTTEPANDGVKNTGYAIGPARFTVNYEKANDRNHEKMTRLLTGNATYDMTGNDMVESHTDRDNIHLGMEYATGNGRVNAAVNVVRMKDLKKGAESDTPDSADLKTFSIGYTYDVSDSTSLYGLVARTEYEKDAMAAYTRGNGSDEDSVTGFRFGMTHKF